MRRSLSFTVKRETVKEHGAKVARKIVCEIALELHEGNLSCEKDRLRRSRVVRRRKKTKEIRLHKR